MFRIYADFHRYGADPLPVPFPNCNPDLCEVILGDYIDFRNARKEDEEEMVRLYNMTKAHFGPRYLSGNHCCFGDRDVPLQIKNILFMHGDSLVYGRAKSEERRSEEPFATPFKRFWKKWASKIGSKLPTIVRIKPDEIAHLRMEYHFDTIVMGHIHPRKMKDVRINGVRVLVLPRGVTEIEL